jgi:hypothetical protein
VKDYGPKRRKTMMVSSPAPAGDGQDAVQSTRPLWLPPGVTFNSLPAPVQQAVLAILNPIFEEQVLGANNALEYGQGLSYCTLLFFELMATHGMMARAQDIGWDRVPGSKGLAALVNLSSQKNRVANFLLALQKYRSKRERADAPAPETQPGSAGSLE